MARVQTFDMRVIDASLSGIIHPPNMLPHLPSIIRSLPNPMDRSTLIRFALPSDDLVTIGIFNVRGQRLSTLVDGAYFVAGEHEIHWDGTDEAGNHLPPGHYYFRVANSAGARTARLVILR